MKESREGMDRRRSSHTRAAGTAAVRGRLALHSGGSRSRGSRGCRSRCRSSRTRTCKVDLLAKWPLGQSGRFSKADVYRLRRGARLFWRVLSGSVHTLRFECGTRHLSTVDSRCGERWEHAAKSGNMDGRGNVHGGETWADPLKVLQETSLNRNRTNPSICIGHWLRYARISGQDAPRSLLSGVAWERTRQTSKASLWRTAAVRTGTMTRTLGQEVLCIQGPLATRCLGWGFGFMDSG